MFWEILKNFALQNLVTIGAIVLFGFLIAMCNRIFYWNFGRYGRVACYITGAIGTPVHECSHALMCILFGHRITEMKLYQIGDDEGILGYVSHSYNKRNVYQRLGNFFIGIAPIIVISSILYGVAFLLMPDMIKSMSQNADLNTAFTSFGGFFSNVGSVLKAFFIQAKSWQWWVFILIGGLLCLHMTLSGADIKSAIGSLIFIVAVSFVVNLIIGFIKLSLLDKITYEIVKLGSILVSIMLVSLLISILAVLFSFIIRLIFRRHI